MTGSFVLIDNKNGMHSLIWSGFNTRYSRIFKQETHGHENGDGYSWNNLLLKTFEHEQPEILSELMFDPSTHLLCLLSRKKKVLLAAASFFNRLLRDEELLTNSIRNIAQ